MSASRLWATVPGPGLSPALGSGLQSLPEGHGLQCPQGRKGMPWETWPSIRGATGRAGTVVSLEAPLFPSGKLLLCRRGLAGTF